MKLILSNDDGIYAEGIRALALALKDDYELVLCAPDTQRSCVSRAMTLAQPLYATPVDLAGLADVKAYAISGTPVDCVRLGLGNLAEDAVCVVSGINHGCNVGTEVLYSGTVAAAHEAALLNVQGVAISIHAYHPEHFETAAHYARLAVRYIEKHPLPFGTILNVNVPDLPLDEVRGVRFLKTGVVDYELKFAEQKDAEGRTCYLPPSTRSAWKMDAPSDAELIDEGYVTVTPLQYDLTHDALLRNLSYEDWINTDESGHTID